MADIVPPGLKPDPAIDEWLRRQQSKELAPWPGRAELLSDYRQVIATLEQLVRGCPHERWKSQVWEVKPSDAWMLPAPDSQVPSRGVEQMQVFGSFWYVAFHCIFYLDFYLSQIDATPYRSPRPFGGPKEHDVDEHGVAILPYREYTRGQLLAYLSRASKKAQSVVGDLTIAQARTPCPATSAYVGQPFLDLLQINLAHGREHASQLTRIPQEVQR